MTDNRTTELRAKLMERGVKYQSIGKTLTYWNRDGSDNECDDADFVADERPDGTFTVEGLTPEQAVAATLSKPNATNNQESIVRSFLRKISPNRDWDYLGEHEHAMIADLVDDIAATLGSGTLTAEQVREAIEAWNTRHERTCKVVGVRYDETWDEYCIDLSCGCQLWRDYEEPPSYCEECGAKIQKVVKR